MHGDIGEGKETFFVEVDNNNEFVTFDIIMLNGNSVVVVGDLFSWNTISRFVKYFVSYCWW